MPRTKTNGNGHKQPKIEDFEMVSTSVQTEQEAITLPQEEITWEEALKLTGCPSRALLVLRLAPMLPDVDVDGLTAIPLAFQTQLEEIKAQVVAEEATKKLGASIPQKSPLPLPEAPVTDLAIVDGESTSIAPEPPKGRGRLKKADQLKESQELVVKQVKDVQLAATQRKSKAKANNESDKKNATVKGRLRAVTQIAVEQSAYEEVLDAFENKRTQELDTEFTEFLDDINASLKAAGAKVRVLTDEQIEKLKAESVSDGEAQEDFLSVTANLWG